MKAANENRAGQQGCLTQNKWFWSTFPQYFVMSQATLISLHCMSRRGTQEMQMNSVHLSVEGKDDDL
jgi:hypothetical protein